MYLMDKIHQTAALIPHARPDPVLRGYFDVDERLVGAPRFLLDAKATRTAVELNLGRPKILREAMAHLRVPYTRLWVEWADADREELRLKFPDYKMSHPEQRPMPGRVGFLLEADPRGRRGVVTWAWDTPDGPQQTTVRRVHGIDIPNIGVIEAEFDLDRVFPLEADRALGLMKGNLVKLWEDNPVQKEALFDIWRTSIHRPAAWGPAYFAAAADPQLQEALSYADVVGEYIMIWATLLLLTASRPIVDLVAVDLGRLNKQRAKRREVPLLDHTRVALHLTPQVERPVVRGELGYSRKSPRIHMVSSYLARRGSKHWIVSPYFRGSGDTISRHVHVRG